jgi:hypothetical protein
MSCHDIGSPEVVRGIRDHIEVASRRTRTCAVNGPPMGGCLPMPSVIASRYRISLSSNDIEW